MESFRQSLRDYITSIGRRGWAIMSVAVFTCVGTFLNVTGQTFTNFPTWAWITILVTVLIITPFTAFHKVSSKLRLIERARPRIVLVTTENIHGQVITRLPKGETIEERPWFARVQFANDPESLPQAVEAQNVVGHITFYDKSRQQSYFTMVGRWAETKEVAFGGKPIETDQIPIPPTGRPYIMDIGLKYHDENEFYGYNNETPRKKTVGFRDEERQLSLGAYSVKVRLRGNNVDAKFWFDLKNPGKGKEVELVTTSMKGNIGI